MEQFVLIPPSLYNKSLITHSITKQEVRKYQPLQIPKYKIVSLKKKINKKLLAEADFSVHKNLSCPRTKLSNLQTLNLDGVETEFLPSNFAQQLRRKKADVPNIYFTLLDAAGLSPTLILNPNAKVEE